jgi:AcrR family transcriptional regulator
MIAPRKREGVKRARQALYRQLVIEAGERVFAERGYEGTRMQDVAKEAGLSLATVYAAVGGKEEVFAEIHRTRGTELLARAARTASESGSALGALMRGVEAYVMFLAEHPDYLRIHLKETPAWALGNRFTCEEQARQWKEGLALTVGVFRAGIEEGSIVKDDPRLQARLMISAHQVFLTEWVESGMKASPAALIERMQRHLERAFVLEARAAQTSRRRR